MESGNQPCESFDPGGGEGALQNYHECPGCPATRRFCNSCNRDHHEGGWDSCLGPRGKRALNGGEED